jgi:hypothetical protein
MRLVIGYSDFTYLPKKPGEPKTAKWKAVKGFEVRTSGVVLNVLPTEDKALAWATEYALTNHLDRKLEMITSTRNADRLIDKRIGMPSNPLRRGNHEHHT